MKLEKYRPYKYRKAFFDGSLFDSFFPSFLDRFFNTDECDCDFWSSELVSYKPKMQTYSYEDKHLICINLPGYGTDDIKVDISENTVRIIGELKNEEEKRVKKSSFYKEFGIPSDVDTENISAKLDKGILNIVLPRKKQERREIEVK